MARADCSSAHHSQEVAVSFDVKQIIVAVPGKGRIVFDDTGKCVTGDRKWMINAAHKVAVRGQKGESIAADFNANGTLVGGSSLVEDYLSALKPKPPTPVPDLTAVPASTVSSEDLTPVSVPKAPPRRRKKKSDDD